MNPNAQQNRLKQKSLRRQARVAARPPEVKPEPEVKVLQLEPVYQPFEAPAPTENKLPAFLTEEPQEASDPLSEVDFLEVKRFDVPFFVEKGYQLEPSLEQILKAYSHLATGLQKCYRCKGTGVAQWRNAGATAKVCRCVRDGAALEETAGV